MSTKLQRVGFLFWCAMTLVTLFFYPLIATANDALWYLQWTALNSLEFYVAYVVFSVVLVGLLWRIERLRSSRLKLLFGLLIAIIPFSSFTIHLVRQLGVAGFVVDLTSWLQGHVEVATILAILFVAVLSAIVFWFSQASLRFGVLLLFVFSPLNVFALIRMGTLDFFRYHRILSEVSVVDRTPSKGNIFILVFEDMSKQFLYDSAGHIRPDYPHIAALSQISDNYLNAKSSGENTLESVAKTIYPIPDGDIGLVNGRLAHVDLFGKIEYLGDREDSIFAKAQRGGYTVEVYGPYFRYCFMLKKVVDRCRSYSAYNYASVKRTRFSPWNPVATVLILWPGRLPFGWLNRPVEARWQRHATSLVDRFAHRAIGRTQEDTFLFAHYYIPHLPFAFDRNGPYHTENPVLESDENYARQLQYVDTVVGRLIADMKEHNHFTPSTVVIATDENFRKRFPDLITDVPLIVKRPRQSSRRDIVAPVTTADVLWDILPASAF